MTVCVVLADDDYEVTNEVGASPFNTKYMSRHDVIMKLDETMRDEN